MTSFVLALALLGASTADIPAPNGVSNYSRIHYAWLAGTWSCRGTDATQAPLRAKLQWATNDGGDIYYVFEPQPANRLHPKASEGWTYETDGGANLWRAEPDAGAADPATWTSGGWHGTTLQWVRMAAESTMSRVFTRTAAGRLTIVQRNASGIGYRLACRQTHSDLAR